MSNVKTNKFGGALLFILGEFAAADAEMIEDGGMEVFGEDDQGREGSCEVSINDLAQAASHEINHLTEQLAKVNERESVLSCQLDSHIERVKELEQVNLELAANVEACCELTEMDMGAAIERLFEIDNTESKSLLNKFAIEKKLELLSDMVSSANDYLFNHDILGIRANHLDMLLKNFCNYHREQLRKEQE